MTECNDLKRRIGVFTATVLVIANMVGSGIFTTSGFIIAELGNPLTMLACWLAGGIFALCGALCYGELGAMFPKAGGEYIYLKESLGKLPAFLTGWISLIVGFSAPIAAVAIAFSTYFFQAADLPASHQVSLCLWGKDIIVLSPQVGFAILVIILFSLIHHHSLMLGSRVQNFLTGFKIVVILSFIAAGLWLGNGSTANFSYSWDTASLFNSNFAVSLIFVSFAYSGWNAASYLGGEILEPKKNIPLALFTGTFIVMLFYLLLNIVYIYALPVKDMSGVLEVGAKSAVYLFGKNISRYFSAAIAFGLLSALSAMVLTGPRVYYAMAKDGIFFRIFSRVHDTRETPGFSIMLQAVIAILMVITASFDKLLIYIGFTLSFFAMLTVIGMLRLRFKKPASECEGEYKTFGYPVTPIIFIAGNIWIICFSIIGKPVACLSGLATIGLGALVFLYFNRKKTVK